MEITCRRELLGDELDDSIRMRSFVVPQVSVIAYGLETKKEKKIGVKPLRQWNLDGATSSLHMFRPPTGGDGSARQ